MPAKTLYGLIASATHIKALSGQIRVKPFYKDYTSGLVFNLLRLLGFPGIGAGSGLARSFHRMAEGLPGMEAWISIYLPPQLAEFEEKAPPKPSHRG